MSGKSRIFRRKADSETADEPENTGVAPASALAGKKSKDKDRKSGKKPSLLSFDEDESVSPGKARPESKLKGRAQPKVKPDLKLLRLAEEGGANTQRSAAGEYSAERLQELRANAKSFTGPRAPMSTVHGASEEEAAGGGFKLSGSFKPAGAKQAGKPQERFLRASNCAEIQPVARVSKLGVAQADSADPVTDISRSSIASQQPAYTSVASQREAGRDASKPLADLGEAEEDFHAPSAEMIKLAKQKRERLRSAHLAPDYVPLGGAAGLANLEARLKPEGGLQQTEPAEPGSDASDEEGQQQRMTFVGDLRRRTPAAAAASGGSHSGVFSGVTEEPIVPGPEQEDDDDWVREQIRKGVGGGAPLPQQQQEPLPENFARLETPGWLPSGSQGRPLAGTKAAVQGVAASAETALKTLQQGLERVKMKQTNIASRAARTQDSLASSIQSVAQLQGQLQASSQKYTYLQELRAYIADLCDMLQAKAAIVEELEEQLLAAGEQRAAAAAQRNAGDEAAEMEQGSAAVSAALGVLSRGGEPAAAAEAAVATTRQAEDRLGAASGPPEVDEFGRDIGREADLEETRRKTRLHDRQQKWQAASEGLVGEATTDESDSEESQYVRRRREVLETSSCVFADADDEYRSLEAVKRRLETWKLSHPEAYANAYMGYSVPAIFAPFVRNELLAWDPVFSRSIDFDKQHWYDALLDFGHAAPNGSGGSSATEGDELIPTLVSNLVLPLARHAVQELLAEVRQRLESAVSLIKLPPWPQPALVAAPNAALMLGHQFGKALRLLADIAAFDAILPRAALQTMAFERLVQQQLLVYATAGSLSEAVRRSERLTAAIPSQWLAASGRPQGSRAVVEAFSRLGRSLEGLRRSGPAENAGLARRLAAVLALWGEKEAGHRLRTAYGI